MSRSFVMPDLGEGLTEAEVVGWLVAPGDAVAVDQPVVELESAKSVVQLPTPFAGVVQSLGGEIGQVLHTGDVLLTLTAPTALVDAPSVGPADPAGADASAEADGSREADGSGEANGSPEAVGSGEADGTLDAGEGSGAVLIGYGTRTAATATRPARVHGRFGTRTGSANAAPSPAIDAGVRASSPGAEVRSPVLSPIVRRLAREHGLDASRLLGSGPDHLVLRRDVERAIAERAGFAEAGASGARATAAGSAPAADATDVTGERRVPLDRMARTAAAHFERSRREIPDATVWLDVDATGLLAVRRELEQVTGERFGVTALIARFAVAGLARHPRLNGSFDGERRELVLHDRVNLGIATQTARGLMVPVVHGVDAMSLRGLRSAIAERGAQASSGAFPPDALTGGTFTLNNYGALGVDGSAAILNHPEAAMLGVGRLIERPWVVAGELAVRTVTELTLSFDHRVCDGAEAAAFLTFVAGCIEHPLTLLADL